MYLFIIKEYTYFVLSWQYVFCLPYITIRYINQKKYL